MEFIRCLEVRNKILGDLNHLFQTKISMNPKIISAFSLIYLMFGLVRCLPGAKKIINPTLTASLLHLILEFENCFKAQEKVRL